MSDANEPKPSRRSLLGVAVGAGACALGAAVAAPVVIFVAAPANAGTKSRERFVPTVPLESLAIGKPTLVKLVGEDVDAWTTYKAVDLGSAWIVRTGPSEVRAMSSTCPHLGCAVRAEGEGFTCPCHTSAFTKDGKRTAGPSPRDLDALSVKIDPKGVVLVDFRRFRIGVAEKVELG
jgi:Rieske Fe-S protein